MSRLWEGGETWFPEASPPKYLDGTLPGLLREAGTALTYGLSRTLWRRRCMCIWHLVLVVQPGLSVLQCWSAGDRGFDPLGLAKDDTVRAWLVEGELYNVRPALLVLHAITVLHTARPGKGLLAPGSIWPVESCADCMQLCLAHWQSPRPCSFLTTHS